MQACLYFAEMRSNDPPSVFIDFAEDPTKVGTDAEFAATLKKVRELTPRFWRVR